jgi:hypothetical protein
MFYILVARTVTYTIPDFIFEYNNIERGAAVVPMVLPPGLRSEGFLPSAYSDKPLLNWEVSKKDCQCDKSFLIKAKVINV